MSLHTDVGDATVTQVCELFGISRSAYYQAKAPSRQLELNLEGDRKQPAEPRYASTERVRAAIHEVVDANPAWGVRKVWATLRREYDLRVGHKRVWALMNADGLTLPAGERRLPELPRGQVTVEEPDRRWATDLTTVYTEEDGVVAVVPVVDCGCRSVLAVTVTKPQNAIAVLAAVRLALDEQFGDPACVPDGLELRTDHGPQYTGADCAALCDEWGLEHSFAPVGRPTGNAVAERLIRTMKEECIWLRDWRSVDELRAALDDWQRRYNERRPHQALGWATPEERRCERLGTTRVAA